MSLFSATTIVVKPVVEKSGWVTPAVAVEPPSQHFYPKRSQAAQIGSVGLDKYFDGIDPHHQVFSKGSNPSSNLPKMMKALRFFKI